MKNTIYALLAVAMMTACSSDDMPLTQSDEAKIMTFNVSMGGEKTRASSGYHDWNDKDPSTMSVFGYAENEAIFTNQLVTYSEGWTYNPLKYWADYADKNTYEFVACMPHNASATYDKAESKLQMPVTISDGYLTDSRQFPLVSNAVVQPGFGTVVSFKMDQTLTGFNIRFKLGEDMGKLRYFNIKEVKLSGNLPVSGTVTRDYTNGTIVWSNIITGSKEVNISHTSSPLKVDDKAEYAWGGNVYVIPSATFNPTITVTYDVHTVYDGKDEITRKDVTSTIDFTKTNFTSYTSAAAIHRVNTILIKIVPDYLYVLADSDQTVGYLVIN